jgi:hypothetical protein
MSHTIELKIVGGAEQLGKTVAHFHCHEPHDAWCRRSPISPWVDREKFEREFPDACRFTVFLKYMLDAEPWCLYDGPPTELRSGEIEFTAALATRDADGPLYFWHYQGDTGGHYDRPDATILPFRGN